MIKGGVIIIPPITINFYPRHRFPGMYTPPSGGGGDLTSQLNQLAQIHQSGALTDAEYKSAKNRVLGLG